MKRELSLLALASALSCHSATSTSNAPSSPRTRAPATARSSVTPEMRTEVSARLSSLLARLGRVTEVSASSYGEGGEPGAFYLLWLEFEKSARATDYAVLAEDPKPIVRAMGFVGLAQGPSDDAARQLLAHLGDRAPIEYFPGGCVGSKVPLGAFARALLEDAHHLGAFVTYAEGSAPPPSSIPRPLLTHAELVAVDLEVLSHDELAGLPFESSYRLGQAMSEGRLAVDLRALTELGRFRQLGPLEVIKATGRIDVQRADVRRRITALLVGALHDEHLAVSARLAAASALTRSTDPRALDAIEGERRFLDGAGVGALAARFENEIRTRRTHDALMAPIRTAKLASETEALADQAARAYDEDHPLALDDLLDRLSFGEHDRRIAAVRAAALLRMAARFSRFTAAWDTYADAPYRIAWMLDPDYHVLDDADRAARERLETAVKRFASRK